MGEKLRTGHASKFQKLTRYSSSNSVSMVCWYSFMSTFSDDIDGVAGDLQELISMEEDGQYRDNSPKTFLKTYISGACEATDRLELLIGRFASLVDVEISESNNECD